MGLFNNNIMIDLFSCVVYRTHSCISTNVCACTLMYVFYNHEFCQDFIGLELNQLLGIDGLTVVTSLS